MNKDMNGIPGPRCDWQTLLDPTGDSTSSPAAKGGNPQISGIVFFSLDYSSLGCI